jgi:hypothetical protein
MSIYDLIKYKIRVIAHPGHFERPKQCIPLDVEGTCLSLNTHGNGYSDKLMKEGKILELIFGEEEDCHITVRWDNDTKKAMYPGSMLHRSSQASKCMSIWTAYPHHILPTDERLVCDLSPRYYQKKQSLFDINMIPGKITNYPAAKPTAIPTMFKSIREIPEGHPNALIQDGPRLIRVDVHINHRGEREYNKYTVKNEQRHRIQRDEGMNAQYANSYDASPRGNKVYKQKYAKDPVPKRDTWDDETTPQDTLSAHIAKPTPVYYDLEDNGLVNTTVYDNNTVVEATNIGTSGAEEYIMNMNLDRDNNIEPSDEVEVATKHYPLEVEYEAPLSNTELAEKLKGIDTTYTDGGVITGRANSKAPKRAYIMAVPTPKNPFGEPKDILKQPTWKAIRNKEIDDDF